MRKRPELRCKIASPRVIRDCTGVAPIATTVEQPSKALLRLNLDTRALHRDSDEPWLSLLRPQATRADYVQLLLDTYGFEAPLEAAFAYTPSLKLAIDLRQRSRAGLLAKDLLTLGIPPVEVANIGQYFEVTPFSSAAEALGWMYVTERLTLVHDSIRRQLTSRIADIADASSYISAYAGVASGRWISFGHALDRVARTDAAIDEIVAASRSAFRALSEWTQADRTRYARGA